MNLAAIDLNLLLTLHAVLEEGSATKAAARLHVTQSAVSNAIARLRKVFDDPLVVRAAGGLAPTPRALALRGDIAEVVARSSAIFAPPATFDPQTAQRAFTVACADNQEISDVPRLLAAIRRRMPRCHVRIATVEQLHVTDALGSGEVDVVFAPLGLRAPGLHHARLYEDRARLAVRKKHPALPRLRSGQGFDALQWVDVHVVRGGGIGHRKAAAHFRKERFTREVVATVPHFIAAAAIVAATDLAAALPDRFARTASAMLPIALLPPPPAMRLGMPLAAYWHARSHRDEGARFFRKVVQEALRQDA